MPEARVVDIQIQPIKGGGPLKLGSARITKSGLETIDGRILDHSLFVVDVRLNPEGDHPLLTQRTRLAPEYAMTFPGTPKLALIRPRLNADGLVLTFDGADPIGVPGGDHLDATQALPVRLFRYRGQALEVRRLSQWLTTHLDRDVKVVRTSGPWDRMTSSDFAANENPLRAQDGYPVHAVVRGDVEAAFRARGATPDAGRFRYQILLEGLPLWSIHEHAEAVVGGVRMVQAKPCDRCEVTAINQETGELSDVKPLAGLRQAGSPIWIRPDTGGRTRIMGESWIPLGEVVIGVGDTVHFRGRRSPLNLDWRPKREALPALHVS